MLQHEKQQEIRTTFRRQLVAARAAALADSEDSERVIFAIEALGRYLYGADEALGKTSCAILCWVENASCKERRQELSRKLELLRDGRNQRMHKGFAARDLTRDAVRVAMILEEMLMAGSKNPLARDVMTPNPVTAREWYTFGMVRDAMVENSFSYIPIFHEGGWRVISDRKVVELVQKARKKGGDLRSVSLSSEVQEPLADEHESVLEFLLPAEQPRPLIIAENKPLVWRDEGNEDNEDEDAVILSFDHGCVLVVRAGPGVEEDPTKAGPDDLVGIITPADIM